MRSALDRRLELLDYLSEKERTFVSELASIFRVSTSTIRRDINALSIKHDIEAKPGPGGGIRMRRRDSHRHLNTAQEALLRKLLSSLTGEDHLVMKSILDDFADKPM